MNKLRSLILNNFWWKALSFIIGVVIWFVGINISKPIDYQTFSVPISYSLDKLEASNLVLMNEDSLKSATVTVKVSGRLEDMQTLTRDSFRASINLGLIETLTPTTRAVLTPTSVSVEILNNARSFDIILVEPSTVDVLIDDYRSTTRKINVGLTGDIAENFRAMTPVVKPDVVQIEGAQSALNNIGSVRIDISIKDAKEDITKTGRIRVYDINDKEITSGLILSVTEAEVTVPVYMIKTVPVMAPTITAGTPREGYIFVRAETEPATVQVIGSIEAVSAMRSIILEPVNVKDQFRDFKYTVDIHPLLPDGVEIVNGTPSSVNVTAFMGQVISKTFTVPVTSIEIIYGLPYIEVAEEFAEVTVSGLKTLIDAIVEEDIAGKLDLTDYGEGEYTVTAEFEFAKELTVLGSSELTVKLSSEVPPDKEDNE